MEDERFGPFSALIRIVPNSAFGLHDVTVDGSNVANQLEAYGGAAPTSIHMYNVDLVHGNAPYPDVGGGSLYADTNVVFFLSHTRIMYNTNEWQYTGGGAIYLDHSSVITNGVSGWPPAPY